MTYEGNRRRFRVSNRAILLVRFDPGARLPVDTQNLQVETVPRPNETVRLDPRARPFGLPSDVFRAAATSQNADLASAISRVSLADGLSRFLDVQPLRTTRAANSHRSADELSLLLAWKDFPFDARIIRALMVLHFEGTIDARTWGAAGDAPRQIATTYRNLRLVGMADEVGDQHGVDGDTVEIKCRDLTGVLIDTHVPDTLQKRMSPGSTILEVVASLLATLRGTAADFIRGPELRGIEVSQLPKLSLDRYPKLATSARSRNKAGQSGGVPMVLRRSSRDGGETYWDAITDLCVSHGLVPFIDRDVLVLQPPRTLYVGTPTDTTGAPTFPTTYRRTIGDTQHPQRRMVWGGNVSGLRFHRKLGRVKAPVVRVTSFDPNAAVASRRLLEVYHPANYRSTATKVSPSGTGAQVEIHNVVVQGVRDLGLLRAVAEATYEAMGRAELGVTWSTADVASWSDHPSFDPNADPDLLDLRAGDPVELLVTPTQRRTGQVFGLTELGAAVSRSRGGVLGAADYLVGRGWTPEDAQQLARVLGTANLLSVFRVQTVGVTIDGAQGSVEIAVDMRDYIRARADPDDSARTGGVGTTAAGGVVT